MMCLFKTLRHKQHNDMLIVNTQTQTT